MLLDFVSVVLVEPGQVCRSGRFAAGVPIYCGQPRSSHRRTSRQPGRSISFVPLPFDHELRGCLPERIESKQGNRQDQRADGSQGNLTNCGTEFARLAELLCPRLIETIVAQSFRGSNQVTLSPT